MACQARPIGTDEVQCGPCGLTWAKDDPETPTCPGAVRDIIQVAGTHYAVLALDPFEFCMTNGWDFVAASALKYLSRYARKNGVEDLRKARNCIEQRRDRFHTVAGQAFKPKRRIAMHVYCERNCLPVADRDAHYALEHVVRFNLVRDYEKVLSIVDGLIGEAERENGAAFEKVFGKEATS